MFHEDAGIEETHRDAVWEKIAWYLWPHTWHRRQCRVQGREPSDTHGVRHLFEESPIGKEAEYK